MHILRRYPLPSAVVIIIVLIALWAAFRPELLFVHHHVDDPFPSTTTAANAPRSV